MFLVVFTAAAQNWPSFRGPDASGAADGQKLPVTWDIRKGINIAWKTPIPGLAHSSPIVWGDRIFVTTAVSTRTDAGFKRGLYGDGDASDDRSVQQWKLLCLNAKSGAILWERVAYQGVPKEKRHVSTMVLNISEALSREINEMVEKFREEVFRKVEADRNPQRIMQLSVAYVPKSRIKG